MLASRPGAAGNIFSMTEEVLACSGSALNAAHELLLTPKEIERTLNSIEDRLVDDPKSIALDALYFEIKDLVGSFAELTAGSKLKLIGLVQSAFSKYSHALRQALTVGRSSFEPTDWKMACEMYAVVLWSSTNAAEAVSSERPSSATSVKLAKGKTGDLFDWSHVRSALLDDIKSFVSLSLGRVFDSTTERESVVSCLLKTVHRILENPENVKNGVCRRTALEILADCACNQGCTFSLQTIILQDLIYFEHLAEPIAELLRLLYASEDSSCAQMCAEVLKTMGNHRFSPQESTASTKIAAIFFAKFASVCPKEALKLLTYFVEQIDSEAYVIRMAMVEVIGVLIHHLMTQEDRSDSIRAQTKSLFIALEERFRDVNSFVRSKTLQVCCDLAKSSSIPINKRPKLLQLTSARIMDKSSNVRRKAIQLLGDFLRTHPFCADGGELNLVFFQSRLADIDRLLNEIAPPEAQEAPGAKEEDEMELIDEDGDAKPSANLAIAMQSAANSAHIGSLLVQKQYYTDAVKFVTLINAVVPTICLLLSSTTKSEVFEVMEFLVEAHIYKLETANEGIRRMIHLIWERELSTEDGAKTSIREHLIENYRKIYLDVDDSLTGKERATLVARNLISLVDRITIAELASLNELFGAFMKKGLIGDGTIQHVFSIFASNEFDRRARRSALIILALLSRNKRDVVERRLDAIIKLGLGSLGQSDPLTAQYTLIAVRNLAGPPEQSMGLRLPHDNILFERIKSFVSVTCTSPRWFSVITHAIDAIFLLADKPDVLAAALLADQIRIVFDSHDGDQRMDGAGHCSRNQLCKLLLMTGHVASCYAEHLNLIERHGKDSAQKLDASVSSGVDADLAKVSASAEDDFAELVKGVREHEVLFGPQSILTTLAPLVAHVCSNNTSFSDVRLQRVATLALAKLMAVSSVFCEQHLQLFLTILERSADAVIRSNMVIALGDLAQSFNRLVDQNIDYLFHRLRDHNLTVRRNTLMVLTHLSLTGMIKVKGQIGEIAKCLIDSDDRIRNLAKVFFSEMAARDSGAGGAQSNGIYNHIPDILSSLSMGDAMVSEDDFHTIMRFIFDFIKKERQMENLIEKLCLRFRQSDSVRHARDLAYCLNLISFAGDRALRRLIEALPLYQDKLVDEGVLQSFVEIVNRSRKFCKAEVKPLLDEFEQRLLQAANGNLERSGEGGMASFAALSQSINRKTSRARKPVASGRKPATRRSKAHEESDDEDGDYHAIDSDDGDGDETAGQRLSSPRVAARSTRRAAAAVKFYEEDAEDSRLIHSHREATDNDCEDNGKKPFATKPLASKPLASKPLASKPQQSVAPRSRRSAETRRSATVFDEDDIF